MNLNMQANRKDYLDQATYLKGAADALRAVSPEFSAELTYAAERLNLAGNRICAQGYFGCYAGERCTSDHK